MYKLCLEPAELGTWCHGIFSTCQLLHRLVMQGRPLGFKWDGNGNIVVCLSSGVGDAGDVYPAPCTLRNLACEA